MHCTPVVVLTLIEVQLHKKRWQCANPLTSRHTAQPHRPLGPLCTSIDAVQSCRSLRTSLTGQAKSELHDDPVGLSRGSEPWSYIEGTRITAVPPEETYVTSHVTDSGTAAALGRSRCAWILVLFGSHWRRIVASSILCATQRQGLSRT